MLGLVSRRRERLRILPEDRERPNLLTEIATASAVAGELEWLQSLITGLTE
jgi:hypothetical protein